MYNLAWVQFVNSFMPYINLYEIAHFELLKNIAVLFAVSITPLTYRASHYLDPYVSTEILIARIFIIKMTCKLKLIF